MSLFKQFKTDASLETKGVIIQYGYTEDNKPIQIKICRAGGANTAYSRVLESKVKPYRRQIQNDTMDRDTMIAIMREVFADTVVIGWENVQDQDGNDLAFNRTNVIKLFEELPELFEDIQAQANNVAIFREEILASEAKN